MSTGAQLNVVNLTSLEVRLDSLDDATRHSVCLICKQRLDYFEGVEECNKEEEPLMVTRLACLHLYHQHCIVKYSDKHELCPSCLIPMPTIKEEETQNGERSKPPGLRRLNWPMVLTVSTGGILTAVLVCKLWKQSRGTSTS